MKIVLHVVGMFLLGAVALACVGLLYQSRQRQRIPVGSALPAPAPTATAGSSTHLPAASTSAMLAGIHADLELFVEAMNGGRRAEAMRGLDGAYHVSDVIHAASDRDPAATDVYRSVSSIRRAVQNGDDTQAVAQARATSQRLSNAARLTLHRPADLEPFIGATVISPTGDALGTITGVSADTVRVENGGLDHLLGFIDLRRGTMRDISVEDIVFGEPRRVGMTMVLDASR